MGELEVSVLQKFGSTCIISTSQQGFQWNTIASDFLLVQSINKFNKQITCVTFDRSIKDIQRTLVNTPADKLNNLHFINHLASSSLTNLFEALQQGIDDNKSSNTNSNILFLYSLSEILIWYDLNTVYDFIESLHRIGYQQIITTLNKTLHSSYLINDISTHFSNIIYVLPNDGTLSNDVICQIKSSRRSPKSGKVSEVTELFGKDPLYIIRPLKVTHKSTNMNDIDTSTTTKKPIDTISAVNILTQLSITESTSKVEGVNTQATTTTTEHVYNNINKRLITFDSTDPEFDEDSDPDNDLDL